MNGVGAERLQAVGVAVRARRLALGLNQDDLASRGGPTHMTVRRVEHGESVKWKSLHALALALDWEPAILIDVITGDRDVSALAVDRHFYRDSSVPERGSSPGPTELGFEDVARLVPKLPLSDLNRLMDMVRTAIAIREGGVS